MRDKGIESRVLVLERIRSPPFYPSLVEKKAFGHASGLSHRGHQCAEQGCVRAKQCRPGVL